MTVVVCRHILCAGGGGDSGDIGDEVTAGRLGGGGGEGRLEIMTDDGLDWEDWLGCSEIQF